MIFQSPLKYVIKHALTKVLVKSTLIIVTIKHFKMILSAHCACAV